MQYLFWPSAFLGLCIGSFLNVVIYRLPRKESIVLKKSNCPNCKKNLGVLELIPVLSWLFLKGRCLKCNIPISWRYPFVEILTCISFLICFSKLIDHEHIPSLFLFKLFFGFVLASILIALSFIDLYHMKLPHSLTFLGAFLGFVYVIFYNSFFLEYSNNSIIKNFSAYLIGFFSIYILNSLVTLFINKPGIGTGDAFLFAMSGAWLGLLGLEVVIGLSFVFSGIFSIIGIATNKIKRGNYIPLGPFICISIFLVWSFQAPNIINTFSNVFWWRYL